MIKTKKLAGRAILLAGPPGTGKVMVYPLIELSIRILNKMRLSMTL